MLSFLVGILVNILSGWMIDLFYGPGFEEAANVLRLLIWGLIPFTFVLRFSFDFIAQEREGVVVSAFLLILTFLSLLNWVWIPRLGLIGASWSTLIGECALAICLWLVIRYYSRGQDTMLER